jgi:hypothetical protein
LQDNGPPNDRILDANKLSNQLRAVNYTIDLAYSVENSLLIEDTYNAREELGLEKFNDHIESRIATQRKRYADNSSRETLEKKRDSVGRELSRLSRNEAEYVYWKVSVDRNISHSMGTFLKNCGRELGIVIVATIVTPTIGSTFPSYAHEIP